ncbi:MAG: phosphotransferase [Nitrospiraceae bacterium]|nr:phosphotransferase [Nitrospiraceae bacterium]
MEDLYPIAEHFSRQAGIADICELGSGNINDTFLVTTDAPAEPHFVLQRINPRVFADPRLVMQNIRTATDHMDRRLKERAAGDGARWEIPRLIRTRDGRDYLTGADGSFWRGITFLEGCRSFGSLTDDAHAREVGYGLGMFHALLSDLPPGRLADTLPGFHITPRYLRRYSEVLAARTPPGSAEERHCEAFIKDRTSFARVLEDAKEKGLLLLRPVHGDPKTDNIMMDNITGRAVGVIDLDTVKPGLVHYDIGDCLRSACNPLGEETEEWERVRFDPDICRAVLRGYFSEAKRFLSRSDIACIPDAVRLIAFELGLRFFTDHLEDDAYFKVRRPGHNLARALVQFRLAASIESQEATIRAIVGDLL